MYRPQANRYLKEIERLPGDATAEDYRSLEQPLDEETKKESVR